MLYIILIFYVHVFQHLVWIKSSPIAVILRSVIAAEMGSSLVMGSCNGWFFSLMALRTSVSFFIFFAGWNHGPSVKESLV